MPLRQMDYVWGSDRLSAFARFPPSGGPPSSTRRRPIVQNLRARLWLDEARRLGAREVRVIPTGVAIPETVGEPADPRTSCSSAA